MAPNPKRMRTLSNKLKCSVRAHATLRFHGKRIEIGLRIPPEMEQRIYKFISAKKK
jgi:hypothetical protein